MQEVIPCAFGLRKPSGAEAPLELGCYDAFDGDDRRAGRRLDVVDGSAKFLAGPPQGNLPSVAFLHSLFEELPATKRYDYGSPVTFLEHVLDPEAVLRMARSVLKPDGLVMIVDPNSRACPGGWHCTWAWLPTSRP